MVLNTDEMKCKKWFCNRQSRLQKKTVSCEETRVFLPDRTLRLHFVIPELVRFMRNFWESWTSFLSKKNFLKIKPKLLLVWYYVVLLALKNTSCEKYLFMLFLPFRTKKLPYYVRFRFKKESFKSAHIMSVFFPISWLVIKWFCYNSMVWFWYCCRKNVKYSR